MPTKQNIVGQKFNSLTVIRETAQRNSDGSVLWECKCDCGNITLASSSDLKRGHKKSCGCLQKETTRNIGKKMLLI